MYLPTPVQSFSPLIQETWLVKRHSPRHEWNLNYSPPRTHIDHENLSTCTLSKWISNPATDRRWQGEGLRCPCFQALRHLAADVQYRPTCCKIGPGLLFREQHHTWSIQRIWSKSHPVLACGVGSDYGGSAHMQVIAETAKTWLRAPKSNGLQRKGEELDHAESIHGKPHLWKKGIVEGLHWDSDTAQSNQPLERGFCPAFWYLEETVQSFRNLDGRPT